MMVFNVCVTWHGMTLSYMYDISWHVCHMTYQKTYQKNIISKNLSLLKSSKRIWKQASTSYAFTCEPSWVHFIQNKGCGHWSVCISIKNHDTHTETSNLSTRLWHYMANSSFSKVISREATKVPYTGTFRNILLAKFARSLELCT